MKIHFILSVMRQHNPQSPPIAEIAQQAGASEYWPDTANEDEGMSFEQIVDIPDGSFLGSHVPDPTNYLARWVESLDNFGIRSFAQFSVIVYANGTANPSFSCSLAVLKLLVSIQADLDVDIYP